MKIIVLFFFLIVGYPLCLSAEDSLNVAIDNRPVSIQQGLVSNDDARKNAIASIEYALSYIKKALETDSVSDMQTYAKRAQSAAGDAESFSDDLKNSEAEWYCNKAYNQLRRAKDEDTKKGAEEYLLTAQKALKNALSEL